LDTVPDGGWLDGAYGVVAAVEVAATLAAGHVDLEHGLVTVAFANEEGARGTAGMVGSRAIVGEVTEAELGTPDDEGVPLHERLRAAHATGPLATARWDLATVEAFVELHIEQGPVLDAAERDLGVVTAVTGRRSLDVDVRGRANHAGTTPMDRRHDALAAAAELVLTVEALAREGVVRVATCGRIEAHPGAGNVVPGHVRLAAELRDEDPDRLDAATDVVTSWLTGIARRRGVDITVTPGQRVAPTPADDRVRRTIRRVVAATGRPWTELPSGAGHDAQVLGAHVPMGMIFVPSRGGISHAPDEDTAAEHLVAGAQALCDTLLALDAETGGRTWVDSGGRGTRNHPISAAAPAGATATTGATGERS
ncbi:MAG TPA: hydantoinase/carbamoylase family amidase, partial [Acidimicrobiales bacterium]